MQHRKNFPSFMRLDQLQGMETFLFLKKKLKNFKNLFSVKF
jgi:hypothetical protein